MRGVVRFGSGVTVMLSTRGCTAENSSASNGPSGPFKAASPLTNGKAERFIQTSLREWANARPYPSAQRNQAIGP